MCEIKIFFFFIFPPQKFRATYSFIYSEVLNMTFLSIYWSYNVRTYMHVCRIRIICVCLRTGAVLSFHWYVPYNLKSPSLLLTCLLFIWSHYTSLTFAFDVTKNDKRQCLITRQWSRMERWLLLRLIIWCYPKMFINICLQLRTFIFCNFCSALRIQECIYFCN